MTDKKLTVVTEMSGIDETWQADLVEMIPCAKENKGYNYSLTIIDIFSKYTWAVPVKSKNANDVTITMGSILENPNIPFKHPKFNVGDKVRISKFEHIFEKGYTPN